MSKATRLLCIAALVALTVALATPSFAQVVATDAYQVNYYANNGAGLDQSVRIINTGQTGSPISSDHGRLCADIYVFDQNQEMLECCSCPITANGLLTLSVATDLTASVLTNVPAPTGVIKIVADQNAAAGARCTNAAQQIVAPVNGGLRAFGTHNQIVGLTETLFQPAPLTNTEQAFLGNACSFVIYLGSGRGACRCGTGG